MPQFLTMDRDDETKLSEVLEGSKAETQAQLAALENKIAETAVQDGLHAGLIEQAGHLRSKLERLSQYELLSASGGA